MPEYKVRTRGNARADSKPKVYFTCHPSDIEPWLDSIVADLHEASDCAVYFSANADMQFDDADWELDLGRMQLFVVPITYKLLTEPNRAMDVNIPFALNKKKPVLPIMVETGIDDFYSSRFGELQYLCPHGDGRGGGVDYKNKLKGYLESVLVDEEERRLIREAFDAYVFLSYRKVDRRLADELMRIVHADPRCQRIALWYDEFLVPGESFRENISKALSDSKLFALLVTPNVLEYADGKPNFVMGVEYPAARESGLDVVAVEAEKTDYGCLISNFNKLPKPLPLWVETAKTLLLDSIAGCAIEVTDEDQLNDYLVGLAYLKGIDVEVDNSRGVKLVTKAAEAGLHEAQRRLAVMYRKGDGVELDYGEAVKWAELLYRQLKMDLGDFHPETLASLANLAIHYNELGDNRMAAKLGEEAYRLRRETLGESHPDTISSLNNLAIYYRRLGDNQMAAKLGEEAYRLRRETLGESHPDTISSLNNLANCYAALGDYPKAKDLCSIAYRSRNEVLGELHPDTLTSLSNLANRYWELGDNQTAIALGLKTYQQRRKSLGESHPDALTSLSNLANYYSAQSEYEKALKCGEEAYRLRCEALGKSHPDTLVSLFNLASHYYYLGDFSTASELGEQAWVAQCESLGENHPDAIKSLTNLAGYSSSLKEHRKAAELGNRAYHLNLEVRGESHPITLGSLCNLVSFLMDLNDYQKAAGLAKEAYRRTRTALGEAHPYTKLSFENLERCRAYLRNRQSSDESKECSSSLDTSNIETENANYKSLLIRALKKLKGSHAPKMVNQVSSNTINNAINSYAPTVTPESVVAIDGVGLFSRGRKGVLYTEEGIASSELPSGQLLRYSQIKAVSPYGDDLIFHMNDGTELIESFGEYQKTVYDLMLKIIEIRDARHLM